MRICFIMYPWDKINSSIDSTLRLIHEALTRDHEVYTLTSSDMVIQDSKTKGFCKRVIKDDKLTDNPVDLFLSAKFEDETCNLGEFDVIMMRDDPPLDPLVLNFLDSIVDDVFLINSIAGLREANNKIYTASYYDPEGEFIPATYVSKNKKYLRSVIENHDGDKMIMKPLDGFGGHGVIVIEKSAMQNINSLLDFYIHGQNRHKSNYVIIQDYVEGAELGDVRVLMLHGEPIGAIRRVPAKGEARSNISSGGRAEHYVLTDKDIELSKRIGEKLVEDGIYFAGLDLIGGKLIEVNVLSPGGIVEMNWKLEKTIQSSIIDYMEEQVALRAIK